MLARMLAQPAAHGKAGWIAPGGGTARHSCLGGLPTFRAGAFHAATTPRRGHWRGPAPGIARTAGPIADSGSARLAAARFRRAPALPRGARRGGRRYALHGIARRPCRRPAG